MMETIIQLVMAGIGSVAFGLIFNVNKKYLAVIFGLAFYDFFPYGDNPDNTGRTAVSLHAGVYNRTESICS